MRASRRLRRLCVDQWIWIPTIGAGLFLRLDQLSSQILGGDEWHSLAFLQLHGYGEIASRFGASDHSIPLTLLHRLLYDTVGLSECRVRLAPLTAGLASVLVLPLLLRPAIGRLAAQLFALLLALFPLYVYFSRSARPYSFSVLLALVAVISLHRWVQAGAAKHAVAYTVCAALAPWFHLTVAPFVLAPAAYEALRRTLDARQQVGPGAPRVALVGLAAAIGALCLLAPPLAGDWITLIGKMRSEPVDLETFRKAIELLSGSSRPLVIVLWCAASGIGVALLFRQQPSLATLLAVASLAELAAVLLVGPSIVQAPIVFVRYILPVAAVPALGVAVALASWIRSGKDRRGGELRGFACVALAFAWAASGPLPAVHRRPNDWTNHGLYQFDYDREGGYYAKAVEPTRIPRFYRELGTLRPGEVLIAEAPFHIEWDKNNFAFYQMVHRQRTVVGEVNELTAHSSPGFRAADPQARFENLLPLHDLPRLRRRGVRFVVLHRDLSREIPVWGNDPTTNMAPVIRFFRRHCGAARARDELIVVFDLSRCSIPEQGSWQRGARRRSNAHGSVDS